MAFDGIDWDPMQAASTSFMNTMSFQLNEENQYKDKEIQCPFYDPVKSKTGNCFKGSSCPYKHGPYTLGQLEENPKLDARSHTENVTCASSLPAKQIGADGFITFVWVTTILHPGEFYVLPKDGWSCACVPNLYPEDNNDTGILRSVPGFEILEQTFYDLQKYTLLPRPQPYSYSASQLVAVKLSVSIKKKQWFRAVVVEEVTMDGEQQEAPDIKLRLLDFGLEVTKTIRDVIPLPKKFCHVNAMAFKCRLNGVSPITGRWSSDAINFFRHLLQNQVVILEISKTIYPEVNGMFGLFEKTPYLVDIHVKYHGKFVNVAEAIVKAGYGLQWNTYKWRPYVNGVLPAWRTAFLQKRSTAESIQKERELSKTVTEREDSRLKRYFQRLQYRKSI